jgi:hypothetical protein
MNLFMDKQIECFHKLPKKHRVLHIDATGNLMKIPKKCYGYPKLLSYYLILKDLRNSGK